MKRLLLHPAALLLTFVFGCSLTLAGEAAHYYVKWHVLPALYAESYPRPPLQCNFDDLKALSETEAKPAPTPAAKRPPKKRR